MKKFITLAAVCCALFGCNNTPAASPAKTDSTATAADTKLSQDVEFAEPKYADICKTALAAFSKGDIATSFANYADNAVWSWQAGDSLTGLPAIIKYWTDTRTRSIDSITFTNDIWLPIKVNKPQKGPDAPGVWVIGWYMFTAKYKTGKSVTEWAHHDFHFNDAGKIDRSIQYIDRAPINKALGVK